MLTCALGLGTLWGACSIERNYDVLTMFFDGVPNPNALPSLASTGDPVEMRRSLTYVSHSPYREERCTECHGEMFEVASVTADVCLKCHDQEVARYDFMHAPVRMTACLWCHVPHESAFASLLKAPPGEVCAQCHEADQLLTENVPEHALADSNCTTCHSGHGGATQYMLHDEAPTLDRNASAQTGRE